ncbi:hypothetical protein BD779DRAFT_534264 [Infundibulicybe gibba]|nr:hypothetical protein BD779DRAFT_534264 [Infundibulicybe gibba]
MGNSERTRSHVTIPSNPLGGTGGEHPNTIAAPLMDVILVCALLATYFLPAALHIAAHMFKRPSPLSSRKACPYPLLPLRPPSATSQPRLTIASCACAFANARRAAVEEGACVAATPTAPPHHMGRRRVVAVGVTVAGSVWAVHEIGTRGMRG